MVLGVPKITFRFGDFTRKIYKTRGGSDLWQWKDTKQNQPKGKSHVGQNLEETSFQEP